MVLHPLSDPGAPFSRCTGRPRVTARLKPSPCR